MQSFDYCCFIIIDSTTMLVQVYDTLTTLFSVWNFVLLHHSLCWQHFTSMLIIWETRSGCLARCCAVPLSSPHCRKAHLFFKAGKNCCVMCKDTWKDCAIQIRWCVFYYKSLLIFNFPSALPDSIASWFWQRSLGYQNWQSTWYYLF